jgi:hypothetical protein
LAKTADRGGTSGSLEEHSSDLPPADSSNANPSTDYDYGWEN